MLYENKETKTKNKNKANKQKNTIKKKSTKSKKTQANSNDRIDLDNEIIIGLTPKKEPPKSKKGTKGKKKSKKKNNNKKEAAKKYSITSERKSLKGKLKEADTKRKRKFKILKWALIAILLLLATTLFMMSSVFNIREIVVINNNRISPDEIINLSTLTKGVNMFKISNSTIRNGIKTNAYIENVKIKRNIKGTITLDVEERKPTYMLKFANTYVYINNQGYMLEITEEGLPIPAITGFSTNEDEIEIGKRLNIDDLTKLGDVNKIINTSENSPLAGIITGIDISNSKDYRLTVESEQKTIKLGDMSNINIKLQMAGNIFENERGRAGEIYFQEDAKRAVFKEEVSR